MQTYLEECEKSISEWKDKYNDLDVKYLTSVEIQKNLERLFESAKI
jgi:hypothetical protein